jgi:hypothetical protein
MTARAAREAALGAGAIVTMTTVGAMDEFDLEDLQENPPPHSGISGIDHWHPKLGGRNDFRVLDNDAFLSVIDNVFPDVDVLRVEPVRAVIHDVFNDHITAAPGMHGLAELTNHETTSGKTLSTHVSGWPASAKMCSTRRLTREFPA